MQKFNFNRILKLSTLMVSFSLAVFHGGLQTFANDDPPPPPDDFQIQPTCYQTVAVPTLPPPLVLENQIKQLHETIKSLKQQYKDGKISKETYAVRLKDVEAQYEKLKQQLDSQEE